MEFKINSSPHLRMSQITKKLFNNQFLSDIRFDISGQIIYAHSLELMKRSVVFEQQLDDTWGEKKLIPITNFKYETFLEFIRFLYTDECQINEDNGIELFKLATKYQVIMLENRVINLLTSKKFWLQLYEHCVIEKYEIVRNSLNAFISSYYSLILKDQQFVSLHPDALNEILQFDEVQKGVTELTIFNAFAGWIDNYCKEHEISVSEGRQRFDGLIRQIRFPTLSHDEIRECAKKYPGLLNNNDCQSIAQQVLFGSDSGNDVWISKRRREYNSRLVWCNFLRDTAFETKFRVTREVILHGLKIGVEINKKEIEIEITGEHIETKEIEKVVFSQSASPCWDTIRISLGESIRLKPYFEYSIAIKYLEISDKNIEVVCRMENVDLNYNDPENSIQIIKSSVNLIEMIFKSSPM